MHRSLETPHVPDTHAAPAHAALADMLKARTQEAHTRAERHAVQGKLIGRGPSGAASPAQLSLYLAQLHAIWIALDGAIAQRAAGDPRVAAMVRPYHPHAARVRADLKKLGGDPDAVVPEARAFADWIASLGRQNSPRAVGVWYVLEGSSNGGQFIARALLGGTLKAHGFASLPSFDPHGLEQRPRWQAWRESLNAQPFTERERSEIILAATEAFDRMTEMMNGLVREGWEERGA